MKSIIVLGAGHVGRVIADDLAATNDYRVTLAERRAGVLNQLEFDSGVEVRTLDVEDAAALKSALAGQDAVVSACPYFLNARIAEAARSAGVNYFDLTEDVATTRRIRALAEGAATAFVPQCGLAPGAVGIVGNHLANHFDRTRALHLRVGALPLYPSNALKYGLTWSTAGLINEYCNPCEALRDGQATELLPLEGLEALSLDGTEYEAFNTSGGLGTLVETSLGAVDSLDYKSIRYPGHRALIRMLLHDLDLRNDRATLLRLFERSIPETRQDVVIMLVNAVGERAGHLSQRTHAVKIYGDGRRSAIQATTSAGLCAMVDLFFEGRLPQTGFVRQEDCAAERFMANRFGGMFRMTATPCEAPGHRRVVESAAGAPAKN